MKQKKGKKEVKSKIGIISINSRAKGFVTLPDFINDVEIDTPFLNTALNGDTVEIFLQPSKKGKLSATVNKVVARAKNNFIGVLRKENSTYFVEPDDTKMYVDILIEPKNLNGAKTGEKVYVELRNWQDPKIMPTGKIIKKLGLPGENETEMLAIAIDKGFESTFTKEVEHEAQKIKAQPVNQLEINQRRSFKKIPTFTIDPEDAKDFDDALSVKEIGNGLFEIGIHIADVTYYVTEGSKLEAEAKKRGTSVYLVDRTIPMLPEIISNDLCSLVPHKDRLTMSAVFVLDQEAKIHSEWYGRSIIHSQKRFTYEEAQRTIDAQNGEFYTELNILNKLAKKLAKNKMLGGAISLDQEEVKFVLDKNKKPIRIIKKERIDTHRLVEDFMLLANKKVAEKMNQAVGQKGVFIYRIHDAPSKEKAEELARFLRSLGYKIDLQKNKISGEQLNKIIKELEGKDEMDMVHRAIIRSMEKAIYSTRNIGHYGLAFMHYTHFTSPIRRYPDMMVHRLLNQMQSGKKIGKEKIIEYESIAKEASMQEKRAQEAERNSIKYKQAEYMQEYIGRQYEAIITGIKEWGIFAEETETKCEGLISVRNLQDDYYLYDERNNTLIGSRKKKKYKLGDKIKVKVKSVDLERKMIDYVMA